MMRRPRRIVEDRGDEMADYPDIYADGFSVSAGQFGVTITLNRSEPTGEAGAHAEPTVIVARVRMNQNLAKAVADSLNQVIAAAAQGIHETKTTVRH
jgi:hypothetical protein